VEYQIEEHELYEAMRQVAIFREANRVLDEEDARQHQEYVNQLRMEEKKKSNMRKIKILIFLIAILFIYHAHAETKYDSHVRNNREVAQRWQDQQKWRWEQDNLYRWKESIPYIGRDK
jgi:hypothetical protein